MIAESKLNSMKNLVSRALHDGQISEEEFEKYSNMKQEIRAKKAEITDEQKNKLIQQ